MDIYPQPEDNTDRHTMLAMVAINDKRLPPSQEIFDYYYQNWPSSPEVTDDDRDDNVMVFNMGDSAGIIALVTAPIPWSELEGPCATAWYWPDACQELEKHVSHVIVSLISPSGDLISQALTLTKLVGSVSSLSDSAGIYWGSGSLVHSPETFMDLSSDINRENLPLLLWIDFRLIRDSENKYSLITTGLDNFDLMEIEIINSTSDPESVMEFGISITNYLMENGPIIRDGDTIGSSASQRIKVNFEPSIWDESREVYRIYLP